MSGSILTFNYSEWSALFPEFSNVSQPQATLYFGLAQQYCDNTLTSIVTDTSTGGQRDTFLNLLTAHVAMLLTGTASQPASQAVGRLSDGTEGSVSVSFAMPDPKSATEAFFTQTKYGLMFWAASVQYRTGGMYQPPFVTAAVNVTGPFPGQIPVVTPWPYGY